MRLVDAVPPAALASLLVLMPACAAKKEIKLEMTREEVISKPVIQDVRFEPAGRIDTREAGRTVTVRMTGDSELQATFDVDGRFQGRAMKESQPGVYMGTFDVKQGEAGSLRVTGHLLHPPTGASQERRGGETLELFHSEPPPPPAPAGGVVEGTCEDFDVDLKALTVYFDFNKSALTDTAREVLTNNKTLFQSHQKCGTIYLHGHADDVGSDEYNLHLSMERAQEVSAFLKSLGVPEGRLEAHWHGESQPAVQGETPEAHAKNRRVEFRAVKTD